MSSSAKENYESIPLPLTLPYNGYNTGQGAGVTINGPLSYMKNAVITKYINPTTGKVDLEVRPRGALASAALITGVVADVQNRGIFYWDKTGNIYYLHGDSLSYSLPFNSAENVLSITFTGGQVYNYVHFTEQFDGTLYSLVMKKTNPTSKAYTLTSGNVLTEITDTGYPASTAVGAFVAVDGYVFVMTTDGKIYNSDLGNAASWDTTNVITAAISPDRGIGLAKYKNQVVAFGGESVEFFYDAANATGSPLARTEQAAITGIGCVDAKTIVEMEDTVYWVAGGQGTAGVYKLENFKPKKISNPAVDQMISIRVTNPSNFYAGKIIIMGKEHYYFSVADYATFAIPTMIYDSDLDLWHAWTTERDTEFYQFGMGNESILPSSTYSNNTGSSSGGHTFFPTHRIGAAFRQISYFFSSGATNAQDEMATGGLAYTIKFELRTRPLDFKTHNFVRLNKAIFKILNRTASIPVNYIINNLGRWMHPYFIIAQAGYTGPLTISINGNTAKTIVADLVLDSPVIIDAELQYSVCEH